MKGKLHIVTGIAFLLVMFYNLVVWGGVKDLPKVGPKIRETAQTQAPLVITYMFLGEQLDRAVPALGDFGRDYAAQAFESAVPRIEEDSNMAVVALFEGLGNSRGGTVHLMFWLGPILLVLFLIFWWRRPRKVSLMGR